MDMRKIFPKVGLPVANMGIGDTVNLVAPTELNKDKISFRYDTVASKLNVTIRYTNSVFGANFMDRHGHSSQFMFILPSPPTTNNPYVNGVPTEMNLDIVNCQIQVGNRVYSVQNVENNNVQVVPDDGSESSLLNLPLDHANQLVDEYNM